MKPKDVRAQKFDGTMLDTYGIIVITFLVIDKKNEVRFFKRTFLLANVSPKVVFQMFFVTSSDANINSLRQKL